MLTDKSVPISEGTITTVLSSDLTVVALIAVSVAALSSSTEPLNVLRLPSIVCVEELNSLSLSLVSLTLLIIDCSVVVALLTSFVICNLTPSSSVWVPALNSLIVPLTSSKVLSTPPLKLSIFSLVLLNSLTVPALNSAIVLSRIISALLSEVASSI